MILTLKGATGNILVFSLSRQLSQATDAHMTEVKLCAHHVQPIGHLSRATCRVPRGAKGQLVTNFETVEIAFLFCFIDK